MLELQRERSHHNIFNEKIRSLEAELDQMHSKALVTEGDLSSKRIYISEIENSYRLKTSQL